MIQNHLNLVCFVLSLAMTFIGASWHATSQAQDGESNPSSTANLRAEATKLQNMFNELSRYARNERLRDRLEIVDDQIDRLDELIKDHQRRYVPQLVAFQNATLQAREDPSIEIERITREYASTMFEMTSKTYRELEDIFLPHQLEQLQKITLQRELLARAGQSDGLSLPLLLSDKLGLSNEESRALRRVTEDAREEYQETVAEAYKRANDKVMESLTREQREQLRKLIGEPFNFWSK